jgi:phage terminase large subunit-like protein
MVSRELNCSFVVESILAPRQIVRGKSDGWVYSLRYWQMSFTINDLHLTSAGHVDCSLSGRQHLFRHSHDSHGLTRILSSISTRCFMRLYRSIVARCFTATTTAYSC